VKVAPLRQVQPRRPRSAPKTADWRRQRRAIKHALGVIGTPSPARITERALGGGEIGPPSPTLVDRVVKYARVERLHSVFSITRRIIWTTATDEPPKKVKLQLGRIAAALERVRAATTCLPGGVLDAGFAADLNQLIEKCSGRAAKIAIKRGGGAKAARHVARQKRVAARGAFELLVRFDGCFPEGKRFCALADLLFEAATGKSGNYCRRSCFEYAQAVHRQFSITEATAGKSPPSLSARKRAWRK
jgi:hypothetical protein